MTLSTMVAFRSLLTWRLHDCVSTVSADPCGESVLTAKPKFVNTVGQSTMLEKEPEVNGEGGPVGGGAERVDMHADAF